MKIIKYVRKSGEIRSLLVLATLIFLVGMVNPNFWRGTSILNCFNDSVVFTLLAIGIAFVILTGEIDVSIGAILGLSATVGASLLRDGVDWGIAIVMAVFVGIIIGFINGIGISVMGVPSLIFTLGMNGLVRGFSYVYTKGAWVENLPPAFTKLSNHNLFGDLTTFYILTSIVVVAGHLILTMTRKGRYFTAVGDNLWGAVMVGIPVRKIKILSYILSGVFASLAGLIYTSRIGFITPTAGSSYEMKAIAACVLGGISLSGGQGSLLGAAIGAILMSSIGRILVFLGLPSDYDNTITGILLIAIVVINTLVQNQAKIKNRREILLARTEYGKGVNH